MRVNVFTAALLTVAVSGCSTFAGTANRFESTSVVGYVGPQESVSGRKLREGSGMSVIENPNVTPSQAGTLGFSKDDCVAIDLIGGYFNQSFETGIEKVLSPSGIRNEITLAIAAYERTDSTKVEKKSDNKYPSSAEYNIFSTQGQLANRPMPFESVPIYGPRRYEGGDLVFHISMVEQDEDEARALREDITTQTKKYRISCPKPLKT